MVEKESWSQFLNEIQTSHCAFCAVAVTYRFVSERYGAANTNRKHNRSSFDDQRNRLRTMIEAAVRSWRRLAGPPRIPSQVIDVLEAAADDERSYLALALLVALDEELGYANTLWHSSRMAAGPLNHGSGPPHVYPASLNPIADFLQGKGKAIPPKLRRDDAAASELLHLIVYDRIEDYQIDMAVEPGHPPGSRSVSDLVLVSACATTDDKSIVWRPDAKRPGAPYVQRVRNHRTIREAVRCLAGVLSDDRPRMAVLPELTVDTRALTGCRNDLSGRRTLGGPAYLVLGSRYVGRLSGVRSAVSTVVDERGTIRWQQQKTNRYKEERAGHLIEEPFDIPQRVIVIRDSFVGRMAVLICKDFITEQVINIIKSMQVTVVLVPAMTPGGISNDFLIKARDLGNYLRASVIVTNACSSVRRWCSSTRQSRELPFTGFIYLPIRNVTQPIGLNCTSPRVPHAIVVDLAEI